MREMCRYALLLIDAGGEEGEDVVKRTARCVRNQECGHRYINMHNMHINMHIAHCTCMSRNLSGKISLNISDAVIQLLLNLVIVPAHAESVTADISFMF